MLCFFHTIEDISIEIEQSGYKYRHQFVGVPDNSKVSIDKIYVTTPSDYQKICSTIKSNGGDEQVFRLISPKEIVEHELFPKNVAFKGTLDEAFEPLKDKSEISIAIMNAMSNAFGDHLIGMKALSIYQKKLSEKYPDKKFIFNLFQLDPYRLAPITTQWKGLYSNVGTMPVSLSLLFNHDCYIDFGGLLLYPTFDLKPMIDFFLEGLSMEKEEVSPKDKRLTYKVEEKLKQGTQCLEKYIRKRAGDKKVVLVHPLSTTPIRTMSEKYAVELINELTKQGFFTISAIAISVENKNHMNVHNFSTNFSEFASIVEIVDGIVSVDTSTVHLSDCFNIPTIALYTSIDPKLRTCYYPHVKGVMLETSDGPLYGQHKIEVAGDNWKEVSEYASKIWYRKPTKELAEELKELLLIHTNV